MDGVIKVFPFRKLKYDKYATLDVLMYVEHFNALEFLFKTNKISRLFLQQNFSTLQNEFENEGL